jgi:hypothetical protein
MQSEDLKKERQDFIARKTRRVLGIKALRQIRGIIDDWAAEEASERKFIKISALIFLLALSVCLLLFLFRWI